MNNRTGWRVATRRSLDVVDWVAELFRMLGYQATLDPVAPDLAIDILIERDGQRRPVQVITALGRVAIEKLRADAERVRAYRALEPTLGKPIIAVTSKLSLQAKFWVEGQYDIDVWDQDVLRERATCDPDLIRQFNELITPEAAEPTVEISASTTKKLQEDLTKHIYDNTLTPAQYEEMCMRVFAHLFDPDLYGFEKQALTSDGANRYDFICRIRPGNVFWDGLRTDFRTKAILFECKNYTDGITADQVYSTERYLFLGALRTVCLLVSRLPAKDSAIRAAQGAMRESGKLILLLSNADLIQMLKLKSQPSGADNYLDKKIWDFIISLPR